MLDPDREVPPRLCSQSASKDLKRFAVRIGMSRASNSRLKERLFSSVIALASGATKKLRDPKSAEKEKKIPASDLAQATHKPKSSSRGE